MHIIDYDVKYHYLPFKLLSEISDTKTTYISEDDLSNIFVCLAELKIKCSYYYRLLFDIKGASRKRSLWETSGVCNN